MTKEHLKGRSLLTWLDYEAEDIKYFLELSKTVKAQSRSGEIHQRFLGKSIALLF